MLSDKHLDKFLLFITLLVFVIIWEVVLYKAPLTSVNWLENLIGQVAAALFTLTIGSRSNQRSSDETIPKVVPTEDSK